MRLIYGFLVVFLLIAGCETNRSTRNDDSKPKPSESAAMPGRCIITNVKCTPSSPAKLKFGDAILITYDYEVEGDEGVRITPIPYLNGKGRTDCDGISYVMRGKGSSKVYFTIRDTSQGKAEVDEFRLVLKSAETKEPVDKISYKVDYRFSGNDDSK
ncbi:hypothetical protein P4B35_22035 [Pontiellaceae bacterium B12227]|nr:hypothetical protein [Pontiellaceae bacterium B12227]